LAIVRHLPNTQPLFCLKENFKSSMALPTMKIVIGVERANSYLADV
jgi:hypothetical protein